MIERHLIHIGFLALAAWLAPVCWTPTVAQTATPAVRTKSKSPTAKWTPPRTADGHPVFEGVWNSSSLTPLERPVELGSKEFYSEEEVAAYTQKRRKEMSRERRDGGAEADLGRAYNEEWYDRGTEIGRNRRTSRIVDPPNGRFPPMTPEGQKRFDETRAWLDKHSTDAAENQPLYVRCLEASQAGPPMLPGNYNNNYQIVQTPGYFAILSEQPHQTRIVPLTQHSPLPQDVKQWMGDSRGHWEGDTLVVETSNLRFNDQSKFGNQYDGIADDNLRVTERFARTAADLIIYRATIIDPTVYTKPWTIELPLQKVTEPVYEYACHEGNYGLAGILSGARAEEKKAAEQNLGHR